MKEWYVHGDRVLRVTEGARKDRKNKDDIKVHYFLESNSEEKFNAT